MSNIEEIVLAVTHSNLSRVKGRSVVEGGVNAVKIKFQFRTDDWDGLSKRAVFTYRETVDGANQRTTYVSLNEDGYCDIPPNLITNEGFLSIGVFGVDGEFTEDNFDDYVRIVTGYLHYEIIEGCYVDSDTPIGVSLNAYEEVLKLLDNKSDSDHDHGDKYYKRDEVIASSPEIYVGSGDMPEGYVLQIDPEGEAGLPIESGDIMAILKYRNENGEIVDIPALRGLSAYQVAKKQGFEGTEEEWLASLKGEDGAPGEDGIDGKDGQNGLDGKDGTNIVSIAQVGQVPVVISTDDFGRPLQWQAIDFPEEIYVGDGDMPDGYKMQFIPDESDNRIYTKKEVDNLISEIRQEITSAVYVDGGETI